MKQDRFQWVEHNNIISRSYYFYLLALRPWVRPQTWFPIPNWDWWSVNCYLLQGTVISCALSLASTHGSRHLTNVATSQEDLWVMFSFESPEGIIFFMFIYLLISTFFLYMSTVHFEPIPLPFSLISSVCPYVFLSNSHPFLYWVQLVFPMCTWV